MADFNFNSFYGWDNSSLFTSNNTEYSSNEILIHIRRLRYDDALHYCYSNNITLETLYFNTHNITPLCFSILLSSTLKMRIPPENLTKYINKCLLFNIKLMKNPIVKTFLVENMGISTALSIIHKQTTNHELRKLQMFVFKRIVINNNLLHDEIINFLTRKVNQREKLSDDLYKYMAAQAEHFPNIMVALTGHESHHERYLIESINIICRPNHIIENFRFADLVMIKKSYVDRIKIVDFVDRNQEQLTEVDKTIICKFIFHYRLYKHGNERSIAQVVDFLVKNVNIFKQQLIEQNHMFDSFRFPLILKCDVEFIRWYIEFYSTSINYIIENVGKNGSYQQLMTPTLFRFFMSEWDRLEFIARGVLIYYHYCSADDENLLAFDDYVPSPETS